MPPIRSNAATPVIALLTACAALPAAAQNTEDALPKVVVTGEKTERSLQSTAPSVKVFDAATFERDPGLTSTRALVDGVVNVTSSGTQNLAPAVRGIDGTGPSQGSDAFLAGTRSRLNVQVDGRAASFNEISFGDLGLWDVERVEFFRGAQSTLQGRNAIAGTLVYKTRDPSSTPEYGARFAAGRYDQWEAAGVASGPIGDGDLAYRVAVNYQRNDGYVDGFQPYPGVSDPGRFEAAGSGCGATWCSSV